MALHRGIQSAIFYYLSCAPCSEARYRKKRRKDAIRSRAERAELESEMPEMYRQASPSSTNPYWQAEIAAGPVLASRGKKKTNTASNAPESRRRLKTSMTQRSNGSKTPSSTDVSLRAGGSSRDGRVDSRWQFQQFQREDEPYSGASVERLASSSTLDGSNSGRSGVTRPPRAQVRAGEGRNPQISDLHPATVTKIGSKAEAQWLMAPPPTAEFMSGKERSTRSRSDSGGSRSSFRSGVTLSREVSRRIIEQKMRNGEIPVTPPLSRHSTVPSPQISGGQRHDRHTTEERDFALEISPTKLPGPALADASEDSSNSAQTVVRSPGLLAPDSTRVHRAASRPQLSTIVSDSLVPEAALNFGHLERSKENLRRSAESYDGRDRTARRSAILIQDDSLKTLQDFAPASPIFKTQIVAARDLARDPRPKNTRLPTQDASEESKLQTPEFFDSWYTGEDFQLPEWIHEHTRREVSHRWSMDI